MSVVIYERDIAPGAHQSHRSHWTCFIEGEYLVVFVLMSELVLEVFRKKRVMLEIVHERIPWFEQY